MKLKPATTFEWKVRRRCVFSSSRHRLVQRPFFKKKDRWQGSAMWYSLLCRARVLGWGRNGWVCSSIWRFQLTASYRRSWCPKPRYDPHSFHFLLTTPVSSPPDVSTSSLPPTNGTSDTTEKPIGTIRFVPGKSKLTRLAILKDYRKFGFGRVLVEGMENFVRQNAVKQSLGKIIEEQGGRWINIKCHSQVRITYFVHSRMSFITDRLKTTTDTRYPFLWKIGIRCWRSSIRRGWRYVPS